MMQDVGLDYVKREDWHKALPLLETVVKARRTEEGLPPTTLLALVSSLSRCLEGMGDLAGAAERLQDALAIMKANPMVGGIQRSSSPCRVAGRFPPLRTV